MLYNKNLAAVMITEKCAFISNKPR